MQKIKFWRPEKYKIFRGACPWASWLSLAFRALWTPSVYACLAAARDYL